MIKIDQFFLKYSGLIIVITSVFYYLTLERLIHHGNSPESVLLYRGIVTFLITVLFSLKSKQPIIPAKINQQMVRILVAGVALLLAFQSYKYLEASTVSMIGRLDIPFAVLIGFALGKYKANFKVYLSAFASILVLSIFFYAKHIGEGPKGLILGIVSVFMVSLSYTLVKKSTSIENNLVIVNSTNIGCIAVGLIAGLFFGDLNVLHLGDLWIYVSASACQFILNYSMSVLYRNREIEHAERPYLVSSLVLLVIEQLFHGYLFDFHHDLIIVLVVGVIYLITLNKLPNSSKWVSMLHKKSTDNEYLSPIIISK